MGSPEPVLLHTTDAQQRVLDRALKECEPAQTIFVGRGLPQQLRTRLNGSHSFTNAAGSPVDVAVVAMPGGVMADDSVENLPVAGRTIGLCEVDLAAVGPCLRAAELQEPSLDMLISHDVVFEFAQGAPVVLEILDGHSALDVHRAIGRPLFASPRLCAYGA